MPRKSTFTKELPDGTKIDKPLCAKEGVIVKDLGKIALFLLNSKDNLQFFNNNKELLTFQEERIFINRISEPWKHLKSFSGFLNHS